MRRFNIRNTRAPFRGSYFEFSLFVLRVRTSLLFQNDDLNIPLPGSKSCTTQPRLQHPHWFEVARNWNHFVITRPLMQDLAWGKTAWLKNQISMASRPPTQCRFHFVSTQKRVGPRALQTLRVSNLYVVDMSWCTVRECLYVIYFSSL